MLDGRRNFLSYNCPEVNRTVPYFKEFTPLKYPGNNTINEYLASTVRSFQYVKLDFNDKDSFFPERQNLPDGAFRIRQASKKKLSYNMQMNDLKYWQYHRNNGVTKIGLFDKETNVTFYNIRTIDAGLTIADVLNQAYLRTLFNDTVVVGGVNFFPYQPDLEGEV